MVCDFLQTMLSEMPSLLHLLLRQTIPTEAMVLLLDGVSFYVLRRGGGGGRGAGAVVLFFLVYTSGGHRTSEQ